MSNNLLQLYRLSAFYAANPNATVKDGMKHVGFQASSASFYYNVVHCRDSKGTYPYLVMEGTMMPEDYAELRTRFNRTEQQKIIAGLESGKTIHQIADEHGFHYQPVTYFAVVWQQVYGRTIAVSNNGWCPFSRKTWERLADGALPSLSSDIPELSTETAGLVGAVLKEMFPYGNHAELPNSVIPVAAKKKTGNHNGRSSDAHMRQGIQNLDAVMAIANGTAISPEMFGGMALSLSRVESMLSQLMEETKPISPDMSQFSKVEETFALNALPPHNVDRWLSREALALLPKLIQGHYNTTRDEDLALYELQEAGMIDIPRATSGDMMGSVTILKHQMKITDRGWSLHRMMKDICEKVIYCCLTDIGEFVGFTVKVQENND